MSTQQNRSLQDIQRSGLSLRISVDKQYAQIKTYELYPSTGIVKGFGVNKSEKKHLIDYLEVNELIKQDGIYLLFDQMRIIYVGISQKIKTRLNNHASTRQWDRVVVFYSTRNNINPNIAGYIERRLFTILSSRGFELDQGQPEERYLNDDDLVIMKTVISEIDDMLQLLDMAYPREEYRVIDIQRTPSEEFPSQEVLLGEYIEVEFVTKGIKAYGKYSDYGLEVYTGSTGVAIVKQHISTNKSYHKLLKQLVDKQIVEIRDGQIRFVQSYIFSSSTAAAMILSGSNRPGPLVWKRTSDKKTLKDLETNQAQLQS
jgi:hypothetical protein